MQNTTKIDGIEIRYNRTCSTPTPAETIIFLHGWAGTSKSWEPNNKELSQAYECIAIDMPGFGISTEPSQVWGVQEYAEFVRRFAHN